MIIDIREIKTYYINLKRDVDRKNNIEKLLNHYKFKNFERIDAAIDTIERKGCGMSHQIISKKMINENRYPYLVLEDDANIFFENFIIDVPENIDALYLGLSAAGSNLSLEKKSERKVYVKNINEEMHQVVNMLASHAIIHFNKEYDAMEIEYIDMFLNNSKNFAAHDVAVSQLNKIKNVYALNKPIFYQDDVKTKSLTKVTLKDINFIDISGENNASRY